MGMALAEYIAALGGATHHRCVIIGSAGMYLDELNAILSKAFGSVETVFADIPKQFDRWPNAPNIMFQTAMMHIYERNYRQPILWLEPDCVPTRATWLDEFAKEYGACGCRFMGYKQFTFAKGNPEPVGTHMAGTGVYPPQMPPNSLIPFLGVQIRPFDVYLAAEVVPHMHVTHLIDHKWRSEKFIEMGDEIRCTIQPGLRINPIVQKEAAMIHGCKDWTLLEILKKRLARSALPLPVEKPKESSMTFAMVQAFLQEQKCATQMIEGRQFYMVPITATTAFDPLANLVDPKIKRAAARTLAARSRSEVMGEVLSKSWPQIIALGKKYRLLGVKTPDKSTLVDLIVDHIVAMESPETIMVPPLPATNGHAPAVPWSQTPVEGISPETRAQMLALVKQVKGG